MAGDGGTADIGFQQVLHSWFRKERFTTIMLDNEVYGNTGGQESGMTTRGAVLKMAPLGKKFEKMDMVTMAKIAGCAYIATVVPNNPRRVESCHQEGGVDRPRRRSDLYSSLYVLQYRIRDPDRQGHGRRQDCRRRSLQIHRVCRVTRPKPIGGAIWLQRVHSQGAHGGRDDITSYTKKCMQEVLDAEITDGPG